MLQVILQPACVQIRAYSLMIGLYAFRALRLLVLFDITSLNGDRPKPSTCIITMLIRLKTSW